MMMLTLSSVRGPWLRLAGAGVLMLVLPLAQAATYAVTVLDDTVAADGNCTLREALDNANANAVNNEDCPADGTPGDDIITFASGLAGNTLELPTMALAVDDAGGNTLTIDGGDPDIDSNQPRVLLDAVAGDDADHRVLEVDTPLTLQRVNLAGGRATTANGGNIIARAALTLESVNIVNGLATGTAAGTGAGGAIYIDAGGSLTASGSSLNNNTAYRAGGAIADGSGTPGNVQFSGGFITRNVAGERDEDGNSDGFAPADGGGLHLPNGGVLQEDANVNNNLATGNGGGIWLGGSGTLTITASNLTSHDAEGEGGGNIYNDGGAIEIVESTITDGDASGENGDGGGILSRGGSIQINGSILNANYATRNGGTLALFDGASFSASRVAFANNGLQPDPEDGSNIRTLRGGGIYVDGASTMMLDTVSLRGNGAAIAGGAIWSDGGTLTGSQIDITSNGAAGADVGQGGAGVYLASGSLDWSNSRLRNNAADGENGSGGALFNAGADVTLTRTELFRNTAERAGAAIEMTGGNLQLNQVTLGGDDEADGNMTGSNPGNGGGLHVSGGTARIDDSVVAFNSASQGGGLWNGGNSTLVVTNSTISGNEATVSDGGGIYQISGGSSQLRFSTVAQNRAAGDGGGLAVGATPTPDIALASSLVTGNSADGEGNDFVADAVAVDANTVTTGADSLDDLQLFGGPTTTHPLQADSPAVDAGADALCNDPAVNLRDQRDAERITPCDSGAFERADAPRLTVTNTAPEAINATLDSDLLVLAFRLENTGDDDVTLSGFRADMLLNSGVEALIGLRLRDLDAPLEFEIVVDENGNGILDDNETDVVGTGDGTGTQFQFDGGAGRVFDAGESESLLVVLRALPEPEDPADPLVQNWQVDAPLMAGGLLAGLLVMVRRRRGRHSWLMLAVLVAVGLSACSEGDEIPPPDPIFFGDPAIQGDVRFRLVELEAAGSTDSVVVGQGLPVFGPGILINL
ncbi:MAG: choice-of-anchor Q domain-containing protein [Salinisphaeraceae bacterium]